MRRSLMAVSTMTTALLIAACSAAPSDGSASSSEGVTVASSSCAGIWCPLPPPKPKTRGDVNGDARADIALTSSAGWTTIPVAISQGDSYFQFLNAPITGDTNFASYASQNPHVITGDFDGDGRADVAMAGPPATTWVTIPVAFSRGSSYSAVNSAGGDNAKITQFASLGGTQVVTTDVNGDGKDDLVMTNKVGYVVGLSNGDGTFRELVGNPDLFSGTWSLTAGARLVAGDFNGDGAGDVALVGGNGWGSIPVGFGRRDGSFNVTNIVGGDDATFAGWAAAHGVAPVTGDFNGDGKTDIALAGGAGWKTVPVAFSNGDGSFRVTNRAIYYFGDWATQQTVTAQGIRGPWFVAGDYNGDGKADIALTGAQNGGTIPIAFSNGDGSFGSLTIPFNRPLATFTDLAALGTATALSGSSAAVQTGCDAISNVRVKRIPGSMLEVTMDASVPVQLSLGALTESFGTYATPGSVVQASVQSAGQSVTTVPHVKNGKEYWLQIGPTPLAPSNGILSCGPALVDVPANACGSLDSACCEDSYCNDSSMVCQPPKSSTEDPTCVTCGGEGDPPCDGGACNAGFTLSKGQCTQCGGSGLIPCNKTTCNPGYTVDPQTGLCTICGDIGELACNGNECTGAYTWARDGRCVYSCGLNGEGCCDPKFGLIGSGGWCRDGLNCNFNFDKENTCGPPGQLAACTATKPALQVMPPTVYSCPASGLPVVFHIANTNCATATMTATASLKNASGAEVWRTSYQAFIKSVGTINDFEFFPSAPLGDYSLTMTLSDGTWASTAFSFTQDCAAYAASATRRGAPTNRK